MLVRNWMRENPTTVSGDSPVVEAKRILTENNLRALPVVDNGRLRGMITRAICLRAAEFVTRTQDANELDYFVNRLKVKDLMVRNPVTISADDTMEDVLAMGQDMGISQFPVLKGDAVVGIVSASEVFYMAAQMLGASERWSGITIAGTGTEPGSLSAINDIAEQCGADIRAVYPLGSGDDDKRRMVLRMQTGDVAGLARALMNAGFDVIATSQSVCRQQTGQCPDRQDDTPRHRKLG